jgi:hypothetical protein
MTNKQLIQKEIDEAIATLNFIEEDGSECYAHYRAEIDFTDDRKDETIAELVASADFDNIDFNVGFEQGYLRGLEVALSVIKE